MGMVGAAAVAGLLVSTAVVSGAPSSPPPPFHAASAAAFPEGRPTLPERSPAFPEGPPARLTGGFGEDSCHACHWEFEENPAEGELRISGFPEEYEPGRTYELRIGLERSGISVAGFQLAARHAGDTTQAGSFDVPAEEEDRVEVVTEREIEFAQHRLGGIEPEEEGATGWSVRWTAPTSDARVLLHASAVAGDGDQSQMGDRVYTVELKAAPKR